MTREIRLALVIAAIASAAALSLLRTLDTSLNWEGVKAGETVSSQDAGVMPGKDLAALR